jgi:hypothetical protein
MFFSFFIFQFFNSTLNAAIAYKSNPFTLWVIAYHAVFHEVLAHTALLCDKEVLPHVPAGSLEDAVVFYEGE